MSLLVAVALLVFAVALLALTELTAIGVVWAIVLALAIAALVVLLVSGFPRRV